MFNKDIVQNTIIITMFVMIMMMIIEYINIKTRGKWYKPIKKNKWLQIIIAGLLGVIPGCLGSYTIVSLYTHKIIGFGALATSLIAASGDEAFLMFSLIPKTAIVILITLFSIALIAGFVINFFTKNKPDLISEDHAHLVIHKDEQMPSGCYPGKTISNNIIKPSFQRALLITGIILFIIGLISGNIVHKHNEMPVITNHTKLETNHHEHCEEVTNVHNTNIANFAHSHDGSIWNGFTITSIICALITLFIIITVPDHFLTEHLWEHIIKKHFLKILLWTLGTLALISIFMQYIELTEWIKANQLYILLFALVIGIIPQSGPHIIFLSMFINGTIPLSILIANSIVQDGHGALPLFAESKKSFFLVKLINVFIGFAVGIVGYYTHF